MRNPEYPRESYEAFVRKMIAFKKKRIAEIVTKKYRLNKSRFKKNENFTVKSTAGVGSNLTPSHN